MKRQTKELAFEVCLALIATCLCAASTFAHSDGHMAYDADCCSGQDCAPVIRSELVSPPLQASMMRGAPILPVLWVETIHGKAPILPGTKRRESKDGRMHACILLGRAICIYEAPGN